MKKRKVYVKTISLDVMTIDQDLREDYDLNPSAEMIMERVSDEVSPQLYGMLIQQLLGFHADMQVERRRIWRTSPWRTSPIRRAVRVWTTC